MKWPWTKQVVERPWYEEPGYLKLPRNRQISITWSAPAPSIVDYVVAIDSASNKVEIYTNAGTYLNKKVVEMHLENLGL